MENRPFDILLVEDDDQSAAIIKEMLLSCWPGEAHIERVGSLAETLERLAHKEYDVVLLDLVLPDSSGLETLERVGAAERHEAVVVLTGHGSDDISSQALDKGAQDYLEKTELKPHLLVRVVRYAKERKQLKQALMEKLNQYEHLVDNATDLIFRTDRELRLTLVNQPWYRLLGYEKLEVIGRSAPEFVDEKFRPHLVADLEEQINKRIATRYYEVPVVTKKGEEKWLGVNVQLVLEKGEVVGIQGVARDISELKRTQQELIEAYASMEDMVNKRTQQLETAKRQWEKTFDSVPDLIAIIDNNYRILRVNRALANRLGMAPQEMVGKRCYRLLDDADKPLPTCPHTQLMQDSKEHVAEMNNPRLGGDLLVSTSPYLDEEGRLAGSVTVARDISAIRSAERQMEAQLHFIQTVLDSIPTPIFFKDAEGRYTGCNRSWEQFMGIGRQEMIGKTAFDILPKKVAEFYHRKDLELLAMKPPANQTFETDIKHADGSIRNVIFHKATFTDDTGKVSGMVGNIFDITEKKNIEKALRESEQRYRTIVESMTEGLIIIDEKDQIVYFNKRFPDMLGYSAEEISQKGLRQLVNEKYLPVLDEQLQRRRQGYSTPYELVWRTKDGRNLYTMVYPNPLFDKRGNYQGAISLITDLTERKNLESQLLQTQKLEAIGQLAAGIAHEINTPAQFVSGNTRFLKEAFDDLIRFIEENRKVLDAFKEQGALKEEAAKLDELCEEMDIEYILEEIPQAIEANMEGLERITKIVLSMKEFAHPGSAQKEPMDLNQAILNTVTITKNEWKYVSEVVTDLDPDLPPVPCVSAEIKQVLLNLIVNAAQAIGEVVREGVDEKGTITISTRRKGEWAEIRVADTGPGIPKEVADRIYEPFFTTKGPGKGTGQGLALAYRVVHNSHGGEIKFESEMGKGTTFIIKLPLNEAEEHG